MSCKETTCELCSQSVDHVDETDKKNNKCCIPYSFIEMMLPEIKTPSIKDMTEERNIWGFNKVKDLPMDQVEEVWKKHSSHWKLKEGCNDVEVPRLPSSAIASGQH